MNGILYEILILIKILNTNIRDFQIVANQKYHVYLFNDNGNLTNII